MHSSCCCAWNGSIGGMSVCICCVGSTPAVAAAVALRSCQGREWRRCLVSCIVGLGIAVVVVCVHDGIGSSCCCVWDGTGMHSNLVS